LVEDEDTLARVIDTLKEPVITDPALDQRVMAAIAQETPVRQSRSWWTRRWTIRVSPLGALAAAAGLAAVMFGGTLLLRPQLAAPTVAGSTVPQGAVTQFVLVAPNAQSVALVGDFNDWNLAATQLTRQTGDGVWEITVPLAPGRYRYAFVVDGTLWRPDPNAPSSDDEFGRRNSVVTVGGV
jgi:hypothetical protein